MSKLSSNAIAKLFIAGATARGNVSSEPRNGREIKYTRLSCKQATWIYNTAMAENPRTTPQFSGVTENTVWTVDIYPNGAARMTWETI